VARSLRVLTLTTVCCVAVAAAGAIDTVTIYYWGSENDALALDQIQDFESLHNGSDGRPAINVIMGQSATINKTDDPQRLLTAVAGGDPPDVVWFDRFAVGEWAGRGAFQSLQPFLERDQQTCPDDPFTLSEEQFFTPCWAEANYRGELFAVPSVTDNRILYYNLDALEKFAPELIAAGCVNPDDPTKVGPPRTWPQLKDAARILTEWDDKGRLEKVGFIPNYGNSWLYIYGWLNGGTFMSDDGYTCTLNSPEIVDALAYMTEVYDIMGGAEAVTAFQTALQGGDLDPVLSGRVAMKIDCDWFINHIANMKRDMRFGVALAPAPEGKPQFGWCGGWSWVIPAGASNPDEAWEFIKYMSSQRAYKIRADAQQQAARGAGNVYIPDISARKDISAWAMEHYVYSDPSIDEKFKVAKRIAVEAMAVSKCRPVTPVGQLLWNEQVRAMDSGIYKRYHPNDLVANAKEALNRGQAIVQAELDRVYKPKPYPVLRWWPVVTGYIGILVVGITAMYLHFGRRMQAKGYFRREFYAGYAFASPWFFGFLVFGGGPLVFSVFMSFCEYNVLSPPKFIGFENYVTMFSGDPLFYKSLWNTVFMAVGIPLGMTVSLAIAMLLNYEIKGMAVYRTFFYLPAIMPAVAASILWIWIFNPHEGILNALLGKVGLEGPAWLQNQYWSKPALILMGLWGAGAGMIVWLAGLKGIPKQLYEAAEIDGAGRWHKFRNVTVPMLSPYILFNLIMGLIGTFQIFTQAFIMTQGGPVDSTLFYAYNLFNNAFRYMKMGYASAMAWVLFGIILVLTVIQLRISKHWVHYETEG